MYRKIGEVESETDEDETGDNGKSDADISVTEGVDSETSESLMSDDCNDADAISGDCSEVGCSSTSDGWDGRPVLTRPYTRYYSGDPEFVRHILKNAEYLGISDPVSAVLLLHETVGPLPRSSLNSFQELRGSA